VSNFNYKDPEEWKQLVIILLIFGSILFLAFSRPI
jgi:hypothetical protein